MENVLRQAIEKFQTRSIVSLLTELGGGALEERQNMVRSELLSEYERRMGGDALDSLMDRLGM